SDLRQAQRADYTSVGCARHCSTIYLLSNTEVILFFVSKIPIKPDLSPAPKSISMNVWRGVDEHPTKALRIRAITARTVRVNEKLPIVSMPNNSWLQAMRTTHLIQRRSLRNKENLFLTLDTVTKTACNCATR